MKFKLSFNFDKSGLNKINFRIFWVGLIAGVIMSILLTITSYFRAEPFKNLNPISIKANIFDNISPKIQEKPNNYKLNKKINLLPKQSILSNNQASAYVVVDYDKGEVLAEKNISKRLSIASLTKLMTALVALDLAKPQDLFIVSPNAANQIPTKLGIVPGERMTLEELLHASLMTSANDATQLIEDGINQKYGQDLFITAMNKKVKFLGLKNTSFSNPQGFDKRGNYSTAEDLAILTHYALNNYPLIAEIVQKEYAFLPADENHKQFDLYNWNGLINVYPNVKGVKIGNTDAAGTTTIVLSERNNKKILAVVLGTNDALNRDLMASQLLDMGFEKTLGLAPISVSIQDLQAKYDTWRYFN